MAVDAKQIWQGALEKLRLRISPAAYTTWCQGTVGLDLDGHVLTVGVPTSSVSEQFGRRFQEQARIAVSEVLGRRAEVMFVARPVLPMPPMPPETPLFAKAAATSRRSARVSARVTATARTKTIKPATRASETRRPARQPQFAQQVALAYEPHLQAEQGQRAEQTKQTQRRYLHALPANVAQPALPLPLLPPEKSSGRPMQPNPSEGRLHSLQTQHEPSPDLQPRYRFETFIAGAANQLAYAAAQEIAHHPGAQYNPLLIYGGPGLGKTHLLHAIGHQARQDKLTVAYVTAERFTNEIIEAIRQRTTNEFRTRYRAVDMLLVDDVQFIAGKESTEEEFFHTFNALHEANKQIVLSSDRVPHAMSHLHDRLRSRFQWGLIADMHIPDFEHRLAILRAKAASSSIAVPEEVLLYLARPECESIRALEGSLNRVVASAQILGQPLDARLAARTLAPLAEHPVERTLTPEGIIQAVARHFKVTLPALEGSSRERAVAWARQVAMYLLREETSSSLLQIGQHLGGRDHTTVLHGCQRISKALAQDDLARADVAAIRASLR